MKPYEQYKHSGIDWLGQVPSHWAVKKITHIFRKIGSGTTPTAGTSHYYDNGEINWLQTGDLNDGIINETSKKITPKAIKDFSSLKMYSPNSLVVAMYGATIGKVGLLNIYSTTNQACCVLSDGHNLEIKYIFYFFQTFKEKIVAMAYGGGQPNISQDLIKSLRICLPPLPEQTAIAKFLDAKTARIQTAIGIKNEQIAKLKEYRQALINQTVTKGLNPNAPIKNSGIDWLGQVPSHWAVKKLKYVLHLSTEKIESQKSDLRYIGMENIVSNTGELTESILQADGIANIFHQDEILFGKLRPYLAKVYLAQMDGICSTEFLVYKTSKQIFNKFAFYLMICQSFIETVNSSTYGTKMPRANSDFLANLNIAIPPLPEQLAIAEFLDEKTARIETAIAQYQSQIERLKEYRQSLISDAVTGKIRIKQD